MLSVASLRTSGYLFMKWEVGGQRGIGCIAGFARRRRIIQRRAGAGSASVGLDGRPSADGWATDVRTCAYAVQMIVLLAGKEAPKDPEACQSTRSEVLEPVISQSYIYTYIIVHSP